MKDRSPLHASPTVSLQISDSDRLHSLVATNTTLIISALMISSVPPSLSSGSSPKMCHGISDLFAALAQQWYYGVVTRIQLIDVKMAFHFLPLHRKSLAKIRSDYIILSLDDGDHIHPHFSCKLIKQGCKGFDTNHTRTQLHMNQSMLIYQN